MKASGKTKVLATTPIIVAGPSEGVIVAQPCVQAPITPYAVVVQVEPIRTSYEKSRR